MNLFNIKSIFIAVILCFTLNFGVAQASSIVPSNDVSFKQTNMPGWYTVSEGPELYVQNSGGRGYGQIDDSVAFFSFKLSDLKNQALSTFNSFFIHGNAPTLSLSYAFTYGDYFHDFNQFTKLGSINVDTNPSHTISWDVSSVDLTKAMDANYLTFAMFTDSKNSYANIYSASFTGGPSNSSPYLSTSPSSPVPNPEPASMFLSLFAFSALALVKRRKIFS